MLKFYQAKFSGGDVSFERAEFSGKSVSFRGAKFSGGQIDFSQVAGRTHPPKFGWDGTPPPRGGSQPNRAPRRLTEPLEEPTVPCRPSPDAIGGSAIGPTAAVKSPQSR